MLLSKYPIKDLCERVRPVHRLTCNDPCLKVLHPKPPGNFFVRLFVQSITDVLEELQYDSAKHTTSGRLTGRRVDEGCDRGERVGHQDLGLGESGFGIWTTIPGASSIASGISRQSFLSAN